MAREQMGGPNQLDLAIGRRMRARRRALGLSQQALAEALGVSFQLVQKYEEGTNRIAVSRLAQVADALNCKASDLAVEQTSERGAPRAFDTPTGAVSLLDIYLDLPDEAWRETLVQQARVLLQLARKGAR